MTRNSAADPCPIPWRGIIPSLNTPFTDEGKVDPFAIAKATDWVVRQGVAGLLFPAVAGEQASLSADEYRVVVESVIAASARRVPAIVSVTAPDRETRLARAAVARKAGAEAVLCQAPVGLAGTALADELRAIADAGASVLMLQDLDFGGGGMAVADILALTERVAALKCLKLETAPAGPKYSALLAATGGRLHVSGGWAVGQMIDALDRGVHAFMPTELDDVWVAIHRLHRAGRRDEARGWFERLLPILAFSNQHIDVSIRFFKRLRKARGLFASEFCRPPVPPLDGLQEKEADRLIGKAFGLSSELRLLAEADARGAAPATGVSHQRGQR
jgi:4-hydroxy-tetrahydrodipicolinate synthase